MNERDAPRPAAEHMLQHELLALYPKASAEAVGSALAWAKWADEWPEFVQWAHPRHRLLSVQHLDNATTTVFGGSASAGADVGITRTYWTILSQLMNGMKISSVAQGGSRTTYSLLLQEALAPQPRGIVIWEHAMNDMFNCESAGFQRCLLESFVQLLRRPRSRGPSTVVLLILWPSVGNHYEGGYFKDVVAPLLAGYVSRVHHGPSLVAFNMAGWLQRLEDETTAFACGDKSSACAKQHRGKSRSVFLFKRGRSIHPSYLGHQVIANVLAQLLSSRASKGGSVTSQPPPPLSSDLAPPPPPSLAPPQADEEDAWELGSNCRALAAQGGGKLLDDESAILRVRLRDESRAFLSWLPRSDHSSLPPPYYVRDSIGGVEGVARPAMPHRSSRLGPCLPSRLDCKEGIAVPACGGGELLRFNLTMSLNAEPLRTTALLWKSDQPLRLTGFREDASTARLEPTQQLSRPCFRALDLVYDGKHTTSAASAPIMAEHWWRVRDSEHVSEQMKLTAVTACSLATSGTNHTAQLHWLATFSRSRARRRWPDSMLAEHATSGRIDATRSKDT